MCYYHQHVFWSVCLSCLPVCKSNFNGWFSSQGKYRATLEFKSSGCALSNNHIYDSSLSICQFQSMLHSVHPPLPARGGVGFSLQPNFKKWGLTGPQLLEGGCWEIGMTFFRGSAIAT